MKLSTLALGALLATSSIGCDDDVNITAPKDHVSQISPDQAEANRRAKCLALFDESASHSQLVSGKWVKRMHNDTLRILGGLNRDNISGILKSGTSAAKRILNPASEECNVDCDASNAELRKFDDTVAQIRLNNCGAADEDISLIRGSLADQIDNHCSLESSSKK